MQLAQDYIEKILSGPDYVYCERLMGRWHLRQCAVNKARGQHDPYSVYVLCVRCPRAKEAEERFGKPDKITDMNSFNYYPTVYLEDDMAVSEPLETLTDEQVHEVMTEIALAAPPAPEPAIEPAEPENQEEQPSVATAMEAPAKPQPMCKHHPDRPARLNRLGRSTGLCEECLRSNIRRVESYMIRQTAAMPVEPLPHLADLGWTPEKETALSQLLPSLFYQKLEAEAKHHYRTPFCHLLYLLRSHFEADCDE